MELASLQLVRGNERFTFECFNNSLALGVCHGILSGKTYPRIPFVTDVRTIVDVGAHVGATSVYFSMIYPNAEIQAFEPDPVSFALLMKNCARFPQVHCHNIGLYSAETTKILYRSKTDNATASIRQSWFNHDAGSEISLKESRAVLANIPRSIDIIKVDTEGCEVPIIYSAHDLVVKAKVIFIEYHSDSDRKIIDDLLGDTHVLYSGSALHPHRGEFCYVARSAFPAGELKKFEIND